MNKTNLVPHVLQQYQQGQRHFQELDIENESFDGQELEGVVFEYCSLYVSFQRANLRNAKFLSGGIKTCDFRGADLTNAKFEGVCVEGALFAGAETEGTCFNDNSCFSQLVTQTDFEEFFKLQ